ncbi:Mu transposase domain-containing protein, partial [Staphylococcus pseudintermedius]|uniref:Mu transposase domain-containing protein n=1 Tax=Staphylococcus pseudintermedius TaxID=283734 RepID=UPI003F661BB6
MNPFFDDFIRRKVTKEEMVIFRKCRYSVAPRYIGIEVEIELSDKEDQVQIYYNGELIRSHPLT